MNKKIQHFEDLTRLNKQRFKRLLRKIKAEKGNYTELNAKVEISNKHLRVTIGTTVLCL